VSGAESRQQVRADSRRRKIIGGPDEIGKKIGQKQASDDRYNRTSQSEVSPLKEWQFAWAVATLEEPKTLLFRVMSHSRKGCPDKDRA